MTSVATEKGRQTMSDLIERSEVLKQLRLNHKDVVYIDKNECARRIEAIPPADAVEVIRCKDCIKWGSSAGLCRHWSKLYGSVLTRGSDFCSYGERKETEHE